MHFVIMGMLANNINGLFCISSLLFTLEDEYGVFHTFRILIWSTSRQNPVDKDSYALFLVTV